MSKQSLRRAKRFDMMNKKPTNKTPLKQVLKNIYSGTVNLETTCNGLCDCCKVACPGMNYCEFVTLFDEVWNRSSRSEKIEMACKSVEYYLHNQFEKFGMKTLIKPCMLLSEKGKCTYYDVRPLNCRLYGLWPQDSYKARVDKFEKAYTGMLTRDQLPLNVQCPNVKRKDDSVPITEEVINGMYKQLDILDKSIGGFTDDQISRKENYRTFHDWFLFTVYDESWLASLTDFMMAASHGTIDAQIDCLKDAIRKEYAKKLPTVRNKHARSKKG